MNDAFPPDHTQRLRLARVALEGLSIGDGFGGFFEMRSTDDYPWHLEKRSLPPTPWKFTDDTNMALSIYDVLRRYGTINQDALAESFAARYEHEFNYGMGARQLLARIRAGESWREVSKSLFNGQGSYGNGGAMRVAPLGAYYAESPVDELIKQAALSAEVTHAHPEGIAGAIAVALAVAVVWEAFKKDERPSRAELIDRVLVNMPESDVRAGLVRARDLPAETTSLEAAGHLGSGYMVAAQDTVPYVLWCAGEYLDDYEEAIWQTAMGLGDTDTTCAMVGGIVGTYVGIHEIPKKWKHYRERLPDWAFIEEE